MKILFLHEVGYLEKPIFEMHEFPEQLAARGHEVAFADYPEGASASSSEKFGILTQGRVLGYLKLRLYSQRRLLPGTFGRLLSAIAFPFFFSRVLKSFRPDIVVCLAVPTSGWQAMIMCKVQRLPFIFRALDVSHKIRQGWFSPLVKTAERIVYRFSTSISANNLRMLQYCQEMSGKEVDGTVHLPPLNLEAFASGDRDEGRNLLGLERDARVVLYLGSFFHFSGLDRCLLQMAQATDDTILLLIGGGEHMANLKLRAERLGLANRVVFTGFLPFDELPDLVCAADVAINPMLKSLVSDCALPHKVLQYMASGIPVVSTNLEGLRATLGDDSGVTFRDSPELVIRDAIHLASAKSIQSEVARRQLGKLKALYREDPVQVFESFLLKWSKA